MAETRHTPGPWMADAESGGCVYAPTGRPVMTAGPDTLYDDGSGWANALLIAAAPELLDALKVVEAALDAIPCSEPGCSCTRRLLPGVQAAIAKAEGR